MDERPKKHAWAFWLIVALIGLPVLYVLSSGPTRPLLIRRHVTGAGIRGTVGEILIREEYNYWRPLFWPLEDFWAWHYGGAWAAPLEWYWDFFPAADDVPRDRQSNT